MSSRFVILLIIVSIQSAATPGQEWVRLPDGTSTWARPAATLVPKSAPIVLKTANLRQLLSKAWLLGGKPTSSLAPGGALIELARILNTGPGLKALHLNRPIYAGLYQPLSLSDLRGKASIDAITNTLGEMIVAVPITSEKRFWHSLDARFQAVESPIPKLRQYRLQADHLDYEAWTRAVLAGKIDPIQVGPEGFARAGNDMLYCCSNGLYVAMTSNFDLAQQIAQISAPQEWTILEQPSEAPSTTSATVISNAIGRENFLAPGADLSLKFRLEGENAIDHQLMRGRLSNLFDRLVRNPAGDANDGVPNPTLDTFSSTIAGLLGSDFNKLSHFEVSLDLQGQKFDLGIRMRSEKSNEGGGSLSLASGGGRTKELERVPMDVMASGWVDVGLGARIKKLYMDLATPLSGFSWFPMTASKKRATLTSLPANKFAYSMNYDTKSGFSFVEWYRPQDLALNRMTALNQLKTKTLLGRTIMRIAPGQRLSWVRTLDLGNGPIYLYRFANPNPALQWNQETTLESTMNRLTRHNHPITVTRWRGLVIAICAEHPLEVLKRTCDFLKLKTRVKSDVIGFGNPQHIELDGQLRPTELQEFLAGASSNSRGSQEIHSETIRYVIGHDGDTRRLHLRGDVKILQNLPSWRSRSQDQSRKIQTRQRMALLQRSVLKFLSTRGSPEQGPMKLEDLFVVPMDKKAILPDLYRFALKDAWGNSITLHRGQDGSLNLLSFGADKIKGEEGKGDDMVLKIM